MMQNNAIYLSGLNGIRAIAAIGVMLSHINISLIKFNVTNYSLFGYRNNLPKGWNLGEQGVTMFFVLSGFLITFLLLKEKSKTDQINIKKFYQRRILRIWPLYYFYLFITLISVFFLMNNSYSLGTISFYIFLMANIPFIINTAITAGEHLWSIAVEEQFYLFWPHIFSENNKEKLFKNFVYFFIIAVIIRFFLWKFYPFQLATLIFTVNRFDCMVYGGIMAIIFLYKPNVLKYIKSLVFQIFSWIIIGVHIINYEIINSIISIEFVTIATGFIILGQISNENKLINLENKLLNFLGKYSYGIYVYHPLIILISTKFIYFNNIDELYKTIIIYLIIITLTLLIAYISYEVFEKRFINLKHKYSIIHSTNEQNS